MDFLIVNLQKRHLHCEFDTFIGSHNTIKHFVHHSWNNALVFIRIYRWTFHSEGFPTGCLTICENGPIETPYHTFKNNKISIFY